MSGCLKIGAHREGAISIGASLVCEVGNLVVHIVLRSADGLTITTTDGELLEVAPEE